MNAMIYNGTRKLWSGFMNKYVFVTESYIDVSNVVRKFVRLFILGQINDNVGFHDGETAR